jgi:hypothetical protein
MTTSTIVKRKAEDFKAGMTLAEVNAFLHDVVRAAGEHPKSGPVRCTVNMRGGIKELSVEVTTDD